MSVPGMTENAARAMYERWRRDDGAEGVPAGPHWDDAPEAVRARWLSVAEAAVAAVSGPSALAADALRAVIDTAPLAIFGLDFDGNVTSWNAWAERMFGFTAAEVLHRPLPIVPQGDEEFFKINLERPQRGETLSGVERKRRRKDGSLVDVAIWNTLQRGAEGAPGGIISIVADITDRKALEEQLRVSQRLEAIGRLSAGIAHDFNNLLTVINGTSQLLLSGSGLDADGRSSVENILKAGERAAELTRQLLAFGRRQMIAPQVLALNTVLSELNAMLSRIVGEDVVVEFSLAPDLEPIRADRSQIEQIVLNLVVNAREAMPAGGRLSLTTSNCRNACDCGFDVLPGSYVLLEVCDTGCGMTSETRRRVFEPFFTTKPFGSASGLGLSSVYGIVRQHGGDIRVESEPGQGARFSIVFPPAGSDEADTPDAQGSPTAGEETILLVEDDPEIRKLAQRILAGCGYTVLDAEGGREALSICSAFGGRIDLLLTDVVMPDLRGPEIAQRAVGLRPGLKVLFLSGRSSAPAGQKFPVVKKPFTVETLVAKVREALDSASQTPRPRPA